VLAIRQYKSMQEHQMVSSMGFKHFASYWTLAKNLIRVFKLIKLRSKITRDLNGEVCTWMLDATFSILDSLNDILITLPCIK